MVGIVACVIYLTRALHAARHELLLMVLLHRTADHDGSLKFWHVHPQFFWLW